MLSKLFRYTLKVSLILLTFGVSVDAGHIPDWSTVTTEPFNLIDPSNIANPILTASDVDDVDAEFVADPFLFFENNQWYLFFEVLNKFTNHGDIALATSSDGFHWTYEQVVLDESFHLSYPYIFKWQDDYYMIPETKPANSIRLYKSVEFPYKWTFESTLIDGVGGLDSSIFYYDGKWWMFTSPGLNRILDLYYSENLKGPWTRHPESPIVASDASLARSGGRSFVFDNNRIIRIAQKSDVVYGQQVRAFEVDTLTETQYEEHEILESPILKEGIGWNATGMHQFDPWWTGSYWLCSVDGKIGETWSIGIYVTDADTDSDGVSDKEEQGPDGNDPDYDGNKDGTADSLQGNVTSIHTFSAFSYITIESPAGTSISNCKAIDNPTSTNVPSNADFFDGFFEFAVTGLHSGDATTVTLYFPEGETFDTYYRYGPTPDNPLSHWYEFLYDGQTGAIITGNTITLHLIDAIRGDDDLTANGTIADLGGPGLFPPNAGGDGGSSDAGSDGSTDSSSGGSGGCFVSSMMEP